MIPRIIHQIWKTEEVPAEWRRCSESWKAHNPDWEYRLWTDRAVEAFLRERYPHYRKSYAALSYNIQRADFARYLILHGCGGVYADLDLECLRPISALLDGHRFIACREPIEHAKGVSCSEIIGNAFLASVPGHGLLDAAVREIALGTTAITFHEEVLSSTGPHLLTRVAGEYKEGDLTVADSQVAYPFVNHAQGLSLLRRGGRRAERLRRRLIAAGTWAVHYWANSWVRNLAGELQNPEPNKISGYRFFQGWDSHGFDLLNGGRDVRQLAERFEGSEGVAGFNTDGFVKHRLRAKIAWSRIPGARWNEGLYERERPMGWIHGRSAGIALALAAVRFRLARRG